MTEWNTAKIAGSLCVWKIFLRGKSPASRRLLTEIIPPEERKGNPVILMGR